MADHGSVLLLDLKTVLEITAYGLAGTAECPPSGPTVPTTGQIWPRGNP